MLIEYDIGLNLTIMRNLKNILYSVLALIFVASCSNDFNLYLTDLDTGNKTDQTGENVSIEKLSTDIEDLTQSDAAIVANLYNLYNSNKDKTRSSSPKTLKSIVPIKDASGENAIFAVNFYEGGYIFVSATTKFFPILAIVEDGEYSNTMLESGQNLLIDDMIENIRLAKEGLYDFNCHVYWNQFVSENDYLYLTRSGDDGFSDAYTDMYWEAYGDFLESQDYGNYRIYKLTDCKSSLPDDVYASFVHAAQSEDLWEGTQFSWENTAYVVERTEEQLIRIGPLLSTKWDQKGTFNTTSYDALGCVTIAVGQLMRFFEQPSYYNWNNMPNSEGNETLCGFLSKLRNELKVSSGGSAQDSDAKRVLSNYGYNVTHKSHDASEVFKYLRDKKKPVYASGQRSNNIFKGHAWVVDGLVHHFTNVVYTLYRLSDGQYPYFKYDNAEAADPWNDCTTMTLYHMNWGWGGYLDGWFYDDRIELTFPDGDKRNYSKMRKEIYINNF